MVWLKICLLLSIFFTIAVKIALLAELIPPGLRARAIHRPWLYLVGSLFCSFASDIHWILKLLRKLYFFDLWYGPHVFVTRICWAMFPVHYQCASLFIESLTKRQFKIRTPHKPFVAVSALIFFYFLYLAFFDATLTDEAIRSVAMVLPFSQAPFEVVAMRYTTIYVAIAFVLPSLYLTSRKMRQENLPKILRAQLAVFAKFFIFPYLGTQILQAACVFFWSRSYQSTVYASICISTTIFSLAIFYCIRNAMRLRFLNFAERVHAPPHETTAYNVKSALDQFGQATSLEELSHITQSFFKEAFRIPLNATTLHIRNGTPAKNSIRHDDVAPIVEQLLCTRSELSNELHEAEVIPYDEIEFSNFYKETIKNNSLLSFLDSLGADIFIPVRSNANLVAYITIAQDVRLPNECYNKAEQDEMIIFADCLGNVITLLQNRSNEAIAEDEFKLRQECYSHRQETHLYKESIRTFLRPENVAVTGGVIIYKERRFTLINDTAKQLIDIDLNQQNGHPLSHAMREVARHAESYKSAQTALVPNGAGKQIFIRATPHMNRNCIVIVVRYPNISDTVAGHINLLHDPSQWQILLFLETTRIGHRLNQLLPGTSETILNFKINLLKAALHNKTVFLSMADDDIVPFVTLLHQIGKRDILQTLDLSKQEEAANAHVSLSGLNQTLVMPSEKSSHFAKLSETGTIFIRNVDLADSTTQQCIAQFAQTGTFCPIKGEQPLVSNAHLICSGPPNLQEMVHAERFSKDLYYALRDRSIIMPSFEDLQEDEFMQLVDEICKQMIRRQELKNLLALPDRAKAKLARHRPQSITTLRSRIRQLLVEKSKKSDIYDESQFDPACSISDPELLEAARLGRHALKDSKIMALLWSKFKNQNKIATLLGVNRSSISRRMREYGM